MENKFPIEYAGEDAKVYISIPVNDFKQAKMFYREIFGFNVVFAEAEEMGWLELNSPIKELRIGLELQTDKKIDASHPVMSLSVRNIQKVENFLKEKNVKIGEIRIIPNMVSLLDCWDPFGNMIQIMGSPLEN